MGGTVSSPAAGLFKLDLFELDVFSLLVTLQRNGLVAASRAALCVPFITAVERRLFRPLHER